MSRISYPLIKLPSDVEFSIYLIREELKSRRLFHVFHKIGFDECYFQPNLDTLILAILGLNNISDETFGAYCTIMDKRSKKIEDNSESITKQALRAYHELVNLKESKKSR